MRVSRGLNPQQALFVKLYLGRDDRYHGNATRSYIRAFGIESERSAQVSSSRLLKKPHVKAIIDEAKRKAIAQAEADARFVLEQSVHLYDVAMGNKAVEVDVIMPSGETRAVEKRDLNLTVAGKALDLIGKHTSVQAFTEVVEHTHTHQLVERLNARTKMIEQRAAQQPAIEGHAQLVEGRGEGAPKEGASDGGYAEGPAAAPGKTPQPGAGAKGE